MAQQLLIPEYKFKQFPRAWDWLLDEPGPQMLIAALQHYGLMEHKGTGSFPDFSKWTKELGISSVVTDDDIPWCGVFLGICALRAGWKEEIPDACYRASNWRYFGNHVEPVDIALGDVLVFARKGGHHVAQCVGINLKNKSYACLGGNQSDKVCITYIAQDRLIAARQAPWRIKKPVNVRPIFVNEIGELSSNES